MAVIPFIVSCLTLAVFVITIVRWLIKVDANTRATEELTKAFKVFTDKINSTLFDHEKRISRLEGAKDERQASEEAP